MKKLVLPIFILLAVEAASQEKENIFIAAELNKTKGLSFVYNRPIPKTNFGIGLGAEFIDISTKELGGIMPSVDFRYYAKFGKSTFIPLAQIGYNIYNDTYGKFGTNETFKIQGGPGFSAGLGYSYKVNAKGSGPYTALKYRSLNYKLSDPSFTGRNTNSQVKFSLGWKF